jgi:hypothetical protein
MTQRLYKELGEYLVMLASVSPNDKELTSKIEYKCKDLVEAIKQANPNQKIF